MSIYTDNHAADTYELLRGATYWVGQLGPYGRLDTLTKMKTKVCLSLLSI